MKANDDLLTRDQAAKMLGKNDKYLTNEQQKANRIPYIKKGNKVFYKKEDIIKFSNRTDNRVNPIKENIDSPKDDLPPTVDLSRMLFPKDPFKNVPKERTIVVEGGYLKEGTIKMDKVEEEHFIPAVKTYSLPNQGIESFKVSNKISKDKLTEGIRPHVTALHVSNQKMKDEINDLKAFISDLREYMKANAEEMTNLKLMIMDMQIDNKIENDKGWVIRLCKN